MLAVSALVRAQRGRVDGRGRGRPRSRALLCEQLVDVAPWYELEVQLALARAALRLSDVNGARAQLAAAHRLAARSPRRSWRTSGWRRPSASWRASPAPAKLGASLTTAELRILHFLPTHLSFREIAERTFVSANTVKTQANAVYRKLDVRSRSEAVACARDLGLLDA